MCNGIKIDARADILADVRADAQRRDGSMKPPRCNDTTPDSDVWLNIDADGRVTVRPVDNADMAGMLMRGGLSTIVVAPTSLFY